MKHVEIENTFPIIAFPESLQKIIRELGESRLYATDYLGSAILYAVSVMIGAGSYLYTSMGRTYANLYIALIGPQGANKSNPLEWALAPLHEIDSLSIKEYRAKMSEYQKLLNIYKCTGDDADAPGPKPTCARLLVNDTTPEVLLQRLEENSYGLGQYFDELARMLTCMGRYSRTDNEDLYLSLYSGKPVTIDRVTNGEIYNILHPYYSLIGTTQPQIYRKIMSDKNRYDNGLFSRILQVTHYEDHELLWKIYDDLPSDSDGQYRCFISALQQRRNEISLESPAVYTFDDDAASLIINWQNEHERDIERRGKESDRAVFRKIQLYVLKFALIIQIMSDVDADNVDNRTIVFYSATMATFLADYFFSTALELARVINKPTLSRAEIRLFDALSDEFTTEEGRELAKKYGIGKTCYYEFLNKLKGALIDQPSRGQYVKRRSMFDKKNI